MDQNRADADYRPASKKVCKKERVILHIGPAPEKFLNQDKRPDPPPAPPYDVQQRIKRYRRSHMNTIRRIRLSSLPGRHEYSGSVLFAPLGFDRNFYPDEFDRNDTPSPTLSSLCCSLDDNMSSDEEIASPDPKPQPTDEKNAQSSSNPPDASGIKL